MSERYISGEEHQAMQRAKSKQQLSKKLRWPIAAGVVVLLLGLTFWTGLQVQKHHNTANPGGGNTPMLSGNGGAGLSQQGGGPQDCMGSQCGGGPQTQSGFAQQPIGGTVTSVSATSITIKPSDGSSDRTFTINSGTQMLS